MPTRNSVSGGLGQGVVETQQTQLVLPIRDPARGEDGVGCDASILGTMRYLADQLMSEYDCHIEIVLPRGDGLGMGLAGLQEDPLENSRCHAAFAVIGAKCVVESVKRLLFQAQLLQRYEKTCRDGMQAADITRIAQLLLGEEGKGGMMGRGGVSFAGGDTEPIYATKREISLLHHRQMAENLSRGKACAMEMTVPTRLVGILGGRGGNQQLKTLLRRGVLIDIIGNCSFSCAESECEDNPSTLFLSSLPGEALQQAQAEVQQTIDNGKCAQCSLPCSERLQEWLLLHKREQIEELACKNGVSIEFTPTETVVYGATQEEVDFFGGKLHKLTFEFHQLTVWLPPNIDASSLTRIIEHMAQSSGVEVVVRQNIFMELGGNHEQLHRALQILVAYRCSGQLRYYLTHSEDVREFISGKKDGKLIKIMKDTGVSISLQPARSLVGSQIELEIVATEADVLLLALEQLLGEFPAEICFFLSDVHHKRLIGHGGKNIQRVMKKHAVYIKFLSSEEAREQLGAEAWRRMPKGQQSRIPNVLVRTPAKNEASLEVAKQEILELSEEREVILQSRPLKLSRKALLETDSSTRHSLESHLKQYEECLDFLILPERKKLNSFDDDCFTIDVVGYCNALSSFFESVGLPEQSSLLPLLYTPPSPTHSTTASLLNSPRFPASPTLSAALTGTSMASSARSTNSWTCDSPDLFRLFPSAVFSLPPSEKASRHATTPTLSDAGSLELRSMTAEIDHIFSKPFDPRIGSERKQKLSPSAKSADDDKYTPASPIEDFLKLDWDVLSARRRSSQLMML